MKIKYDLQYNLKFFLIFGFLILNFKIIAQIKIEIIEELKFRRINSTDIGPNKVVGLGAIEVFSDNLEEDMGKKIVFSLPEYIYLNNSKKWTKVEKVGMELENNEIVITREREFIKVYAVLDRRELDRGEDIDIIEGKYTGVLPINMAEYRKGGVAVTLPELESEPVADLKE